MSQIKNTAPSLSAIPLLPGVYLFKDTEQNILYIGKAKSLRTRVRSYFRKQESDWKVESLIKEHASIDYIVTESEVAALLLEAQLIAKHKPKYNVLLTAGNPFLYVQFTAGPLPEVSLVRTKNGKGTYFGPFIHKKEARAGYQYLMRTFRLKLCGKKIESGCLDYHLGICAGSCLPAFDKEEYLTRVKLAQETLKGNFRQVAKTLNEHIAHHNARREFEKAQRLYAYLNNLETIFASLKARLHKDPYEGEIFARTTSLALTSTLYEQGLTDLQKLLKLPTVPVSIDCFDISHFQGRYLVGSCVRFTQGRPDAKGFRRFKIKTLTEQNDYAALAEIVGRRYAPTASASALPDVILIDGGKGQLSAVKDLVSPTICISLAKREETLFTPYHPEGIKLDIKTALGQLLIALRDYAHHFAISYHKLLRTKGNTT